ncbi:DUF6795 domain-containing protein [Limnobacter sp.]|uniref:DUF6795 domain-containing protein n=1 Tax=Limnobacter sp. TaxID=2003368 RepID=UPI00258EC82B|nr:DUF6795 domain-containing protein [Limnobacter sp.]
MLLLLTNQAEAFMFSKNVYCSPVQGVIQLHGKPLPGLQITRTLISGGFKGRRYQDTTKTDANGKFELPEVSNRTFFRPDLLSANPRVAQTISIEYQNRKTLIWAHQKQDFTLGSESLNGNANIEIECDLAEIEETGGTPIIRCNSNERKIDE